MDSQAVVRRKIQDLKQGQVESIDEYSRTWKLATGAYCNFKEDIKSLTVDAFLKGCKDKSAALETGAKNFGSGLTCCDCFNSKSQNNTWPGASD